MAELRALTVAFLNFMSGGEPARLLEARTVSAMKFSSWDLSERQPPTQTEFYWQVCLTDSSKKELMSAGSGKTRSSSNHQLNLNLNSQAGQDQLTGEKGAATEAVELPGNGGGESPAGGT